MIKNYNYSEVALLITHFNRSDSLKRLLAAFKKLNCTFKEIVVSDDGSSQLHLDVLHELKQEFAFRLVLAKLNKGLGNNINKGQKAVTAPLTLYIQEDFVPTELFPEQFLNALELFRERQDLDIIRFYAYYNYPYLRPYKYGYSEMLYKYWYLKYRKIYFYSDHPHLRRSDFLEKFGKYAEDVKGDRMEYLKCIEFLQKKGKGLFYNQYTTLFHQVNSEEEPSTMSRSNWTQTNNFAITILRNVYRQFKYNFDLLFLDSKR